MKKLAVLVMAGLFAVSAAAASADTPKGAKIDGKKEFMEHCNACHANGGNIINPKKTLKKADREANGIKKPADIAEARPQPRPRHDQVRHQDPLGQRGEGGSRLHHEDV